MALKDIARTLRDEVLPRERLRRAHRHAAITGSVVFRGDVDRVRLGVGVSITGPTSLFVTDGGGLHAATLTVGDRTYIGEFNNIRCAGAPITIGENCLISQHITIVGSNHGIDLGTPIVDQPWNGDGVHIGDDVWLGAGCVILPGAHLGDGCVVAANAVVRGEFAANSIIGGVPARVIGQRD